MTSLIQNRIHVRSDLGRAGSGAVAAVKVALERAGRPLGVRRDDSVDAQPEEHARMPPYYSTDNFV